MTAITLDGTDITAYVRSCDITQGFSDPLAHVADVGTCVLVVNNEDKRFSPSNTSSPIYSSLLPYKSVTIAEGAVTLFTGVTQTFRPEPGQHGSRQCTIECVDMLGVLQNHLIALPLQEGQKPGYILKLITSAALRGERATGSVTFSAAPSANDTVTIGDITYTFKVTPSAAYEVKIGASATEAAANLEAAIHTTGEDQISGAYGADTEKHPQVTAFAETGGAAGGTTTIGGAATTTLIVGKVNWADIRIAQKFSPATGSLDSFSVPLQTGTNDTADIVWEIRSDNGGIPGALLKAGSFAPFNGTKTVSGIGGPILYAEQSYWLVLRKDTASQTDNTRWEAQYDASGVTPPAIATANSAFSVGAWIANPNYRMSGTQIVTAAVSNYAVSLTAVARGAWGNSIELAKSGANIAVSGATMSGGVDEPAGLIDFDDGIRTIDLAGDTWRDDETNALTAIAEVAESEWGYFWCKRDGMLTFRNQQLPFLLANGAIDLALDDDHNYQDAVMSADNIINRVVVSYVPRGSTTSGVIARSQQVLAVPGRGGIGSGSSNYQRWNPSDDILQTEGSRTYTIPYVDVSTGQIVGARSLVLPLVPGTDYTVYDSPDKTGFNYTDSKRVKFSVAVTGGGIEVHMTNTAIGTLYVHDLQVRGVASIAYDPLNLVIDDSTSQEEYGRRVRDVSIPLQIDGGNAFAEQVARLLLARYAIPLARVGFVEFSGVETVGAVSLYDIEVGDVVTVTETQTGLSAEKHWVIGQMYGFQEKAAPRLTFLLARLTSHTYLTLDDATLGRLDQNRLAL